MPSLPSLVLLRRFGKPYVAHGWTQGVSGTSAAIWYFTIARILFSI
jgi:hypothetical protein